MTNEVGLSEVMRFIRKHATEDDLIDIRRAYTEAQTRHREARVTAVRGRISIGSKVRIGPSKPKYLAGQTGKVTQIDLTRAHIRLDCGPVGKFRSGTVITPMALLELIDNG